MNPVSSTPAALFQPYSYVVRSNVHANHQSYANCRLIGGGTTLYMSFRQIVVPWPTQVAGYWVGWAGNDPSDTSIQLRLAIYNAYSVNGLPSTVVTNSDTSGFTYASAKTAGTITDSYFYKALTTPVTLQPGQYWIAMVHQTSATISGDHFRGNDIRGGFWGMANLVLGAAGDTSSLNANISTYTLPESATPVAGSFTKAPAANNHCNANWDFICNRI